ncbi:MAG: TetR/AcrR family transcriptional regulator [Myxococcota bacterium]|nr:TetR/AcrR family transcriptional regulator [Myxococcota bacterium]
MARPRLDSIKIPTRQRILKAAEHHFAVAGFAEASLADIAGDAGIRRASLLYHFESKQSLYQSVLETLFKALAESLSQHFLPTASFEERMLGLTKAYLDFLSERPAFAALVVRDIIDDRGEIRNQIGDYFEPVINTIESWVEREGKGKVAPGLDVRAALLLIGSDALLRRASGPLGDRLWGPTERSLEFSRQLFFGAHKPS